MIEISNLLFEYPAGAFRLDIPKLAIAPGEKVALIGPSGTGKTTLLNLMAGISVPSSGSVGIEGLDIAKMPIDDRQDYRAVKMGLIFQEFGLLEYLTVLENICLPYRISPVLEMDEAVLDRARSLAEDVGLGEKLRRFPKRLSQGEKQRIEVCRALVTQPALVLGDEPTGNLDPGNRDHVMELLIRYATNTAAPLVIITHDHELLERFDRTVDIRELRPELTP